LCDITFIAIATQRIIADATMAGFLPSDAYDVTRFAALLKELRGPLFGKHCFNAAFLHFPITS